MADEQVTSGSAGPPQRQPRRRGGAERAARDAARPNLDERERNISPRRKAMGPVVPPEDSAEAAALEAPADSEVPPTDPQ